MPVTESYRPETLHESLGEPFFDRVEAARFPETICGDATSAGPPTSASTA